MLNNHGYVSHNQRVPTSYTLKRSKDLRRKSHWIGICQRVIRVVVPGPQKTEPVAFEDSETMGILENLWKWWENVGKIMETIWMEKMLGGFVGYSVMIMESLWEND